MLFLWVIFSGGLIQPLDVPLGIDIYISSKNVQPQLLSVVTSDWLGPNIPCWSQFCPTLVTIVIFPVTSGSVINRIFCSSGDPTLIILLFCGTSDIVP